MLLHPQGNVSRNKHSINFESSCGCGRKGYWYLRREMQHRLESIFLVDLSLLDMPAVSMISPGREDNQEEREPLLSQSCMRLIESAMLEEGHLAVVLDL